MLSVLHDSVVWPRGLLQEKAGAGASEEVQSGAEEEELQAEREEEVQDEEEVQVGAEEMQAGIALA